LTRRRVKIRWRCGCGRGRSGCVALSRETPQ